MAGPTCGQLLADMGADVVKVERLEIGGDGIRRTAPYALWHRPSHSHASEAAAASATRRRLPWLPWLPYPA
jgi:crotonobetainyl-CoA:carnitine CoA-transferase CaiB-like acyl-CoA transferase|eukprot:COSAG06_NODE_45_length_29559_cov_23.840835_9_plen_71_part_00